MARKKKEGALGSKSADGGVNDKKFKISFSPRSVAKGMLNVLRVGIGILVILFCFASVLGVGVNVVSLIAYELVERVDFSQMDTLTLYSASVGGLSAGAAVLIPRFWRLYNKVVHFITRGWLSRDPFDTSVFEEDGDGRE